MKRRVIHVVLLLVAGAIVNVAVAWACAAFANWPQSSYSHEQSSGTTWPGPVPEHWPGRPRFLVWSELPYTIDRYVARRNEFSEGGQVLRTESFLIDRYSFGWPLRSLRSEVWNEFEIAGQPPTVNNRTDKHPEINIWMAGIPVSSGFRSLPLRSLWPGFAINTIFYAAILWLLFAVPLALRRRRRIKRGQCPACAYDLRGASHHACPECGAAVKAVGTTDGHE